MLKHNEVKPEFTSKYIQRASEKLRLINLGEEQRKAYDDYLRNVSYHASMLWSSLAEEKLAIARNLFAHGVSTEIIVASTGLSFEEIMRLQQGAQATD